MSELIPGPEVQTEALPERVGKRILPALLILAGSGATIGFLIFKAFVRLR